MLYCNEGNYVMTELTIPATVVTIGANAFARNAALKTVTFAEGSQLETMGQAVFSRCTALESIALPLYLRRTGIPC